MLSQKATKQHLEEMDENMENNDHLALVNDQESNEIESSMPKDGPESQRSLGAGYKNFLEKFENQGTKGA